MMTIQSVAADEQSTLRRRRIPAKFMRIFQALAGREEQPRPTVVEPEPSDDVQDEPQPEKITISENSTPASETETPAIAPVDSQPAISTTAIADNIATLPCNKTSEKEVYHDAVSHIPTNDDHIIQTSPLLGLPREIILDICSCFPCPADLFRLGATCKALRTLLYTSWENNRLWYNFLDHTPLQRAVSNRYKSWNKEEVTNLLQLLYVSGATTRQHGYDEFTKVPRRTYDPKKGYRGKVVLRLKELKRGNNARMCYGCFLPANLAQPELWVQFFCLCGPGSDRWPYHGRKNLWYCRECLKQNLMAAEVKPWSKLDLSEIGSAVWPYLVERYEAFYRHLEKNGKVGLYFSHGYPEMTDNIRDAMFARSMHATYREMGGSKKLYSKDSLKRALEEQFGISIAEWPKVETYQNAVYARLKEKLVEMHTEKTDTYTFKRSGILSNDALIEYLDEEWSGYVCTWGLPHDCDARKTKTLEFESRSTKEPAEQEDINIYNHLTPPPSSLSSNAFVEWISTSSFILHSMFISDPILPLSSTTYLNKKSFVQSRIWKHGMDHNKFYRKSNRRAGTCYYCNDSRFYTPYFYAMHLYLHHEFEFYNRSWLWLVDWYREEDDGNVRQVYMVQEMPVGEEVPDYWIREYGPVSGWKKGMGVIIKDWGEYYLRK